MSGRPLDGVWEMPGRSLVGLEKVSGRCPKRMGSLKYQNLSVIEGFSSEFFTRFSFDSKLSTNQFFLPWKSFCSQMNECKYANMVCKYAIIQFCKKITKVFLLEYVIMQLFTPYFGLLYCN